MEYNEMAIHEYDKLIEQAKAKYAEAAQIEQDNDGKTMSVQDANALILRIVHLKREARELETQATNVLVGED